MPGGEVKGGCRVASDKAGKTHQSHAIENVDGFPGTCPTGNRVSTSFYAHRGGKALDRIHVLEKGMASSAKHCYIG